VVFLKGWEGMISVKQETRQTIVPRDNTDNDLQAPVMCVVYIADTEKDIWTIQPSPGQLPKRRWYPIQLLV